MKTIHTIFILLIICITTPSFAQPLTNNDYENIQKRPIKEHIIYETYLETDDGLASVFGYQFDTYFSKNQCFILAISGAVNGDRGGYGFAAFGLGQLFPLTSNLTLNTRGFIGSGGGGGLAAGGGFMLEAHIGIIASLSDHLAVELNTGYLTYPTGTFSTPMVNIGISLSDTSLYLPY